MKRTWEFKIYESQADFDIYAPTTICESYYTNKKVCLHDCKQALRKLEFAYPIVKIQSNDRESIEIFAVTYKFGNIIFSPHKG